MTMQTQTALITSRDPKGMQAVNIFEAAYNKAKLDDSRAQRLNERGDELKDGISKLIAELSVSDRYANEEVQSNYTYPREYDGPKPIEEQITALAEILGLDPANALEYAKNLPELPNGAEGWFAIPKWQTVAPTYAEAVQKVLDAIKQARNGKFYNYRDGQIVNERLRQTAETEAVFQKLGNEQKDHDILVVAAQFGLRYRGRSVRRARECFDSNEFGLGSLAVGSIVLTHPDRLVRWEELDMDCSGDEFDDPVADARFGHAPFFRFRDGVVRFGTRWYGNASDFFGSVSAFVPQS